MHKLHFLLSYLVRIYVHFTLKGRDVFIICGVRRSGNHALIAWLIDALETKDNVKMTYEKNIWTSESGKTLHINEANFFSILKFVDTLRENKNKIALAKNFIITYEDYIPKKFEPFIPIFAKKIKVHRSLLNVVSSRLKKLTDKAKIGLDRGDMSITKNLLRYAEWTQNDYEDDWTKWTYEEWLSNPQYRQSFLNDLGLEFDSKIQPSKNFGGGSSFSNIALGDSKNNPFKRWQQVKLPDRVISLLYSEGFKLLNADEQKFIALEYKKLEQEKCKVK